MNYDAIALDLFRKGYDTAHIAMIVSATSPCVITEADAYAALSRAREAERMDKAA